MAENWLPGGVNVEALEREERQLQDRLAKVTAILAVIRPQTSQPTRIVVRATRGHKRVDDIVSVLKAAGMPMTPGAIYTGVREIDPEVRWNKPATQVRWQARHQSDSPDRIVRVGRGVFGLKAWIDEEGRVNPPKHISEGESAPPRDTKLATLIQVLRHAGAPLSVKEIHRRMREEYPGDIDWQKPAETINAMARKSDGALVGIGDGYYAAAENADKPTGEAEIRSVGDL